MARHVAAIEHLVLAVGALLPQLLTQPGVVDADTKTYLFLEPGRYLHQSLSMWDPTVGLGTVTHQQIGYLFPMGPFFWLTHVLGVPTWAAQRLWVGLILFAAGTGLWWLMRHLGLDDPGRMVASLAYMLSPYTLQYVGHISVILLAFAALPWLVLLVDRATTGSWRPVAVLGLVAAAMGSVNASSAVYVGVGPVLWLLVAGVSRLHPWRAVWRAVWRCALAATVVSAWWVAGLVVEGGYGIDVLRYTETVQAVSTTSLASEVVRGLGYWYFYGGDNFGSWVTAMGQFTEQLWLLILGYLTPLVALWAALFTRWRHRTFLLALTVAGTALAVGAYPLSAPTPLSHLMRSLLSSGVFGLALRSTDRATPLVLLGLAGLLGAGLTALWRRAPGPGLVAAAVAAGVVVAANPALWNGTSVPATFTEKAVTPYEHQVAAGLDGGHQSSAVVGLPGQPFASYLGGTYGSTTVDPIWPALLTRPFVTREQQVMGSLATVDLLYGMDDPVQNGVQDASALAPVARLMGAGDLLVQNNLAFTRYDQPDPAVLWSSIFSAPGGLGQPKGFGPSRPSLDRSTVVDEQTYTLPDTLPPLPSLAVVPVAHPRPLVRVEPSSQSLVVDGDGVGLTDVAGTGLLSSTASTPSVMYAGTLDANRAARTAALRPGATLVVTDSNRRQAFRWDNLTDVAGATLASGQPYPVDPQDKPLDIFPGAPADAQTTTIISGVQSVSASAYGNPFQYLAEDRPVEAVDGNPDTAWQVGPYLDPRGQWWQVRLDRPHTADEVTLLQPQNGPHDQWITSVTVRFDGGSPVRVALGPSSRRLPGQVVGFPARTFRTLRITIDTTNLPPSRTLAGGISAVGLAEVEMGTTAVTGPSHAVVRATEHVVMPSDLLHVAGDASLADRLLLVMTRLRVAPATSRSDPEASLVRTLWLPTTRTFTLSGTARIDAAAPDPLVDALVGRSSSGGVAASSTGRLQGSVADTASAALDGDPGTVWSSPLGAGEQIRQAVTVVLPSPITVDQLHLQLVVDGRHSVPSELRISSASGAAVVTLPKLARQDRAGAVDAVTVSFPPVTGSAVRVAVVGIRPLRAIDYYAGGDVTLPVAIAELGIPGVHIPAPPDAIPAPCRSDLLAVDGRPVPIRVSGSSSAALSGEALSVALCGADAGGLTLSPGTHDVVATPGRVTGLDLDRMVFDSAPGGGPLSGDGPTGVVPAAAPPPAAVRVTHRGATSLRVHVTMPPGTDAPFWLVLGESLNSGWQARVVGGPALGAPRLVDGFANGWLLRPETPGGRRSFDAVLTWAPQGGVDVALVASGTAGALCSVVALWPRRRRRGRGAARPVVTAPASRADDAPVLMASPTSDDAGAGRVPVATAATAARPSWRRVAAAAVGAGVLAGAVMAPVAGAAVALAVAAACLVRWGRLALATAALVTMAVTAVTMVVVEAAGAYPGNGEWPSHFAAASVLTWLALVLVVAEALVRGARGRSPRHGARSAGAPTAGREASPPPSPPS